MALTLSRSMSSCALVLAPAGISRYELDLAAGERVALLFEKGRNPLLHLNAALRERPGLDRQQPDLERRCLRDRRGKAERRRCGGSTGREGTAAELTSHEKPPSELKFRRLAIMAALVNSGCRIIDHRVCGCKVRFCRSRRLRENAYAAQVGKIACTAE